MKNSRGYPITGVYEALSFDYSLVRRSMRHQIQSEIQSVLESGKINHRVRSILTEDPAQTSIDIQQLLSMKCSHAESFVAAAVLEKIIEQRWKCHAHILSCDPQSVDLSVFRGIRNRPYEHMPTKVLPDAMWGGMGKLMIHFKPGAEEDTRRHMHPGGRILFSAGDGEFRCYDDPTKSILLHAGMVVLMPKKVSHNFAATQDAPWDPLSFHLPYVGTGKKAIQYKQEKD